MHDSHLQNLCDVFKTCSIDELDKEFQFVENALRKLVSGEELSEKEREAVNKVWKYLDDMLLMFNLGYGIALDVKTGRGAMVIYCENFAEFLTKALPILLSVIDDVDLSDSVANFYRKVLKAYEIVCKNGDYFSKLSLFVILASPFLGIVLSRYFDVSTVCDEACLVYAVAKILEEGCRHCGDKVRGLVEQYLDMIIQQIENKLTEVKYVI